MKIQLNNKFYSREAIDFAIEAFEGICNAKILDESFMVEIIDESDDEENAAKEFSNYVLGTMKDMMNNDTQD